MEFYRIDQPGKPLGARSAHEQTRSSQRSVERRAEFTRELLASPGAGSERRCVGSPTPLGGSERAGSHSTSERTDEEQVIGRSVHDVLTLGLLFCDPPHTWDAGASGLSRRICGKECPDLRGLATAHVHAIAASRRTTALGSSARRRTSAETSSGVGVRLIRYGCTPVPGAAPQPPDRALLDAWRNAYLPRGVSRHQPLHAARPPERRRARRGAGRHTEAAPSQLAAGAKLRAGGGAKPGSRPLSDTGVPASRLPANWRAFKLTICGLSPARLLRRTAFRTQGGRSCRQRRSTSWPDICFQTTISSRVQGGSSAGC